MTNSPADTQHDIIVIGAGIIGLSIALELQSSGRSVLVVDRKGVAAEASDRNAGAFAFADIVPLATPGIFKHAPKWLLDPLGPLSIPPSYALKITPWMLRFWRASLHDRYDGSITAQAQLMKLSEAALERQITAINGEHMMRREGQLQLYEGEKEFAASHAVWKLRKEFGIEFKLLKSAKEIAQIQPGIHPRFTHAGYTPKWVNTTNPSSWAKYIANQFVARGGKIETKNIKTIAQDQNGIALTTSSGMLLAKQVIVAAGAWSHHLAHTLGDKSPLETERGYNTTLPPEAFNLKTHLTFGGHGFVVSKIDDNIRIGGAVELGGLNLPPNYSRSEVLLQKAAKFLPELKTENGTQWMGFRPSLPDSLPVIDRSPRAADVIYAFGHGHLGLTHAASTAELVTALANRTQPAISLNAFSASRF